METCEHLYKCPYYQEHKRSNDLIHNALIDIYCKGEDMQECSIAKKIETDREACENILPTGQRLKTV